AGRWAGGPGLPPPVTGAAPGAPGGPVRGPAREVPAEVLEEPAGFGKPGTRRGIRAEYLGAVQGRLGKYCVGVAAGDRCPVPHVVIDGVPFAPAVPFPPDELHVFQETDRLGDRRRANPEPPDQ